MYDPPLSVGNGLICMAGGQESVASWSALSAVWLLIGSYMHEYNIKLIRTYDVDT